MSVIDNPCMPLITFCEENFKCEQGAPQAYFEFPHPGKKDEFVRVIYVTYAVRAGSQEGAFDWMIDNVLMPLTRTAGPNPRLYWRLKEKFGLELLDERFILRTRICVMTHDYQPIEIESMKRLEGESVPSLDPRLEPRASG